MKYEGGAAHTPVRSVPAALPGSTPAPAPALVASITATLAITKNQKVTRVVLGDGQTQGWGRWLTPALPRMP